MIITDVKEAPKVTVELLNQKEIPGKKARNRNRFFNPRHLL